MEYIDGEWKGGTLAFSLGGKGANIYGGMFYYELPNNIYDNMVQHETTHCWGAKDTTYIDNIMFKSENVQFWGFWLHDDYISWLSVHEQIIESHKGHFSGAPG